MTLYTVRVTTTTQASDLSYGAKLQISTVVYAFDSLPAARTCLLVELGHADQARQWPGVTVDVDLDSMPGEDRLDVAALRG